MCLEIAKIPIMYFTKRYPSQREIKYFKKVRIRIYNFSCNYKTKLRFLLLPIKVLNGLTILVLWTLIIQHHTICTSHSTSLTAKSLLHLFAEVMLSVLLLLEILTFSGQRDQFVTELLPRIFICSWQLLLT